MVQRRREYWVLLMAAAGLLGCPLAAPAQTVVVTTRTATELSDDLEYVVKSVFPEADPMARTVLDGLKQFRAGAIVNGLDHARDSGLAVILPKNFPDGGPPTVVAAVPVSDLRQFLDSLKALGLTVDDQPGVDGFSHKVTAPNGNPTLFVLQSKGYAFLSFFPGGADGIRAMDPSSWRPKGSPRKTLSVVVRLSELPEQVKKQFLNAVEARADKDRARRPGEQDSAYAGRMAGQNLVYDSFRSIVLEGDVLALDLDVDHQASEITLEAAINAMPNTSLVQVLRGLHGRQSRFQCLREHAAAAVWASFPLSKEYRELLAESIEKQINAGMKANDAAEDQKLLRRFGDFVKSVLSVPDVDLGLAIRPPAPAGQGESHVVVLGGLKVRAGGEFDRLFRDAAARIPPTDNVKIMVDVAKASDATAIHQILAPMGENDPELARRFGKASLFVAARHDAVLVSYGEEGLGALQSALAGLAAPATPGSQAPIAMVARLGSLGQLAPANQEQIRQAIDDVFAGAADRRDRVSLDFQERGNGVRLRLAIDVTALRLIRAGWATMQR